MSNSRRAASTPDPGSRVLRWRYGGGAPARFHLWAPGPVPLRLEVLASAADRAAAVSPARLRLRIIGPSTGVAGEAAVQEVPGTTDVLRPASGMVWRWAHERLAPGIWDVEIGAAEPGAPAAACEVAVCWEGGAVPFLLPEPGIVPSHFLPPGPAWSILAGPGAISAALGPQPSALSRPAGSIPVGARVSEPGEGSQAPIGGADPITLHMDVPDGLPRLTLRARQVDPARTRLTNPDGEPVPLRWRLRAADAHQIAELEAPRPGWWRLDVAARGPACRVAFWEGLPLCWAPPPAGGRFPYARLLPRVVDEAGHPVDARCTLARGGRDCLAADVLAGEQVPLLAPPGWCRLTVSRGVEYTPTVVALTLPEAGQTAAGQAAAAREIRAQLRRALPTAPGWLSGDCHLHSYYEDAPQPPAAVARAARAAGLDYAVLTDYGPETAEVDGFTAHSVPGGLLALPGQEVMTPELHAGALNVAQAVPCPPFGSTPPSWPAPEEIVAAVRQQASLARPVTLVLNHPHADVPRGVEGQASALRAYFRSWWVIDCCPEIAAVENFDWAAWVRRLNAGRRLAPLWTTDTHDVLPLPPGAKRTYLWTAGRRDASAVLDALVAGRSFHTRAPGALLWLTVQGEPPGAIVPPGPDGGVLAHVRCAAAAPLDRVELLVNGSVAATLQLGGVLACEREVGLPLPREAAGAHAPRWWVVAAAYAREGDTAAPLHNEPLFRCGFLAFTSPVYVGDWPAEVPRAWR